MTVIFGLLSDADIARWKFLPVTTVVKSLTL